MSRALRVIKADRYATLIFWCGAVAASSATNIWSDLFGGYPAGALLWSFPVLAASVVYLIVRNKLLVVIKD
jgi:hypothetical protein